MPELLLHYIWQHRLWAGFTQTTTDGQNIEIISIPHPSGANRIYNNSDELLANKHVKNAKEVIRKLIDAHKQTEVNHD